MPPEESLVCYPLASNSPPPGDLQALSVLLEASFQLAASSHRRVHLKASTCASFPLFTGERKDCASGTWNTHAPSVKLGSLVFTIFKGDRTLFKKEAPFFFFTVPFEIEETSRGLEVCPESVCTSRRRNEKASGSLAGQVLSDRGSGKESRHD